MYKFNTLFGSMVSGMLFISVLFCVLSCTPDRKNRPSPAACDSLVTSTYTINIEYSSPRVKKRKVWGGLVPYNTIWRSGANKATYLKTTSDLIVEGDLLEKGAYSIFTIPRENEPWTIILNKEWDQWGSYNYDQTKDALRIEVTPTKSSFEEEMTFELDTTAIRFDWDNLSYVINFSVYQ